LLAGGSTSSPAHSILRREPLPLLDLYTVHGGCGGTTVRGV
jgi:hypothetical protein